MILTINSGSSSLKFAVYDKNLNCSIKGAFDRVGLNNTVFKISDSSPIEFKDGKNHKECLDYLILELSKRVIISGVGHRVVHGGDLFLKPTLITDDVLEKIKSLTSLAPLHQPHNITGIEAIKEILPNIKQVAIFDTSFHSTIPEINKMLPLPRKFFNEGIKSYGFHGLSYDYISRQNEVKNENRVVVTHLGNGSSACALLNNKSLATTMGFTAIEGLMMGTRTGSIDPGVILHLLDMEYSSKDISNILYKQSGLLGVSELSSDVRDLINHYVDGNKKAEDSLVLFADKAAAHILRLVSLLRGMDMLVFTAGIGENSSLIRKMIVDRLNFMGVSLSEEKNEAKTEQSRLINDEFSKVKVLVLPTNEEWIIAEATKRTTE